MSARLQTLVAAGGAGLALASFHLISHELSDHLEVAIPSYLMVAWTGAIGASVNYCAATIAELPIRLYRCRRPRLVWHSPSTTPAIVAGCDGYRFEAMAMLLGVTATELIAILAPGKDETPFLHVMSVAFPIAAVLWVFCVVIQPFVAMHLLVRRERRHALDSIERELQYLSKESPQYERQRNAYADLTASPLLPINSATVVEYSAVLLGLLGAYLVPRFL